MAQTSAMHPAHLQAHSSLRAGDVRAEHRKPAVGWEVECGKSCSSAEMAVVAGSVGGVSSSRDGTEGNKLWEPEHERKGSRLKGKVLLQLAENHECPVLEQHVLSREAEQDGPVALSTGLGARALDGFGHCCRSVLFSLGAVCMV